MKILFSNPPWWEIRNGNMLMSGVRAGSRWPFTRPSSYMPDVHEPGEYLPAPLFLMHAAGYVRQHKADCEVIVRDSLARGESYQAFSTAVQEMQPDAIVIESGSAALEHDVELVEALKKVMPKVRVALAGPVALDAFTKKLTPAFDCYLQGEYEKGSVEFAAGASGLFPYALLDRGDMTDLPHPVWDEDVALHYWDNNPQGQIYPHLQLWSTRGCWAKCSFCAWPAVMTNHDPDGTKTRKVKFHTPEWVENYIRARLAKHPYLSIYFDDDTFNISDRHVLGICEVMTRIGLPWTAMCRADTIERSTWIAMAKAGCKGVKLGFESGCQEVIDKIINKRLNLAGAAETARFIRASGMSVHGTFTIGLPGETPDQQRQTLDFIRELYDTEALDTHQLSGTASIPGTPLSEIEKGAELKAFPGARVDGNYHSSPDGNRKIGEILQ